MVSSSPKEGTEKNPTVLEDTAIVKPSSMGLSLQVVGSEHEVHR
jgi:hypothetical protein